MLLKTYIVTKLFYRVKVELENTAYSVVNLLETNDTVPCHFELLGLDVSRKDGVGACATTYFILCLTLNVTLYSNFHTYVLRLYIKLFLHMFIFLCLVHIISPTETQTPLPLPSLPTLIFPYSFIYLLYSHLGTYVFDLVTSLPCLGPRTLTYSIGSVRDVPPW